MVRFFKTKVICTCTHLCGLSFSKANEAELNLFTLAENWRSDGHINCRFEEY